MNNSAEICRVVLEKVNVSIEEIADLTGLSINTTSALIGRLCGEGAIRRDGERISVGNAGRAKVLAAHAMLPTPIVSAPPSRAPTVKETKPARKRIEIPIPAVITVEKGIPCPPPGFGRRNRKPCPWPFATMAVGDSFKVDVPEGVKPQDVADVLRRDGTSYKRIMPTLRFSIRIAEDDKSVRLWRDPMGNSGQPAAVPSSLGLRTRRNKVAT